MKKRDFWLRLFEKNDVALASAIHLCEKHIKEDSLDKTFLKQKIKELDTEVDSQQVKQVLGE